MSEEKLVISHHCFGNMQMSYSPNKRYFNCFEAQDSGVMVLQEDNDKECLSVDFCPFCGKESKAHVEVSHNAI